MMEYTQIKQAKKPQVDIVFHKPTITKNDLKSVMESLILDELTHGQVVQNFEKEMAHAFDFKRALSVQSLQSAYHLSLLSLDIEAGDDIIMSNQAPVAILDAVGQLQASAQLVDLQRDHFCPSSQQIIEKITPKTKVIILHYPYGAFYDYSELYHYLEENKLKSISVIEDISYIAGSEYNDHLIGEKAKVAVIGLHSDMLMTIGKGAVLLTNSQPTFSIAKDLRMHGGSRPYRVRFDYTIADYQAAMGLEQLSLLTTGLERRKKIGALYLDALKRSGLQTWFRHPQTDAYAQFPVVFEKTPQEVMRYFSSLNIETKKSQPLLHEFVGLESKDFPNSTRLYQRGLLLPLYPYLSKGHIQRISDAIIAFVS